MAKDKRDKSDDYSMRLDAPVSSLHRGDQIIYQKDASDGRHYTVVFEVVTIIASRCSDG